MWGGSSDPPDGGGLESPPYIRLFADDPFFGGGGGGIAAFDHRELRTAHAEGPADLSFDLGGEVGVLLDEQLGVLAALAEAEVAVREPGARLLDDLVLQADVDQLAHLGDALAVTDVELRL